MKVRLQRKASALRGAAALVLATLILALVAGGFWALASADPASHAARSGPGVHGLSAVGHRLLFELLDAHGFEVSTSRVSRPLGSQRKDLLVVIEPSVEVLEDMMAGPPTGQRPNRDFLLVLPKRDPRPDPKDPSQVRSAPLRDLEDANGLLELLNSLGWTIEASVARMPKPRSWELREASGAWRPIAAPRIGVTQTLTEGLDADILLADGRAIVGSAQRVVRWRRSRSRAYVLTDPDLISNHGLAQPGNAQFAVELFEAIAGPGSAISFDIRAQGFGSAHGFWSRLLRPPGLGVLFHLLLAFLVFAASGMLRFEGRSEARPSSGSARRMASHLARVMATRSPCGPSLELLLRHEVRIVVRALGLSRLSPHGQRRRIQIEEERAGLGPGRRIAHLESACRDRASRTEGDDSTAVNEALRLASELRSWRTSLIDESR